MVAFNKKFIDCYQYVPKNLVDNLQFRIDLRKAANKDVGYRRALREICKPGNDTLFYFNAFAWLYEPRPRYDRHGKKLPKVFPFISWSHQDPAILEIRQNLGTSDIGLEKSRGEGASWIAIWLSLQDWCFDEMVTIGYVSRNLEAVYNGKDPNSLFWKLDFGRKRLPVWMTGRENKLTGWERNVSENTFINNRFGNTIIGYAATGDVASGGRTDWFLMDELSKFPRPQDVAAMDSTLSVSDSRLIVGTPKGSTGAYYDVMHEPSSMVKLRLHWSENSSKNRGLYRMVNGIPEAVDPVNNPLPKDYNPPSEKILAMFARLRAKGFDLEKGVRSAWYDKQCDRAKATPQTIAQELDIDYGGSSRQCFGSEFFKVLQKTIKPPLLRGELSYSRDELKPRFDLTEAGAFLLWCNLDHDLRPPRGRYAVGCDLGGGFAGAYTSNSTIWVVDLDTQEQVMSFASNAIQQNEFADLAIAVAKWFHDAKLGWEKNHATAFTDRVREQAYTNVFLRPQLGKRTRRQTARQEVGWWTDGNSKGLMFDDIDFFVRESKIIVRCAATKSECACYVINDKNNPEFEGNVGDKAHGDRVIAMGVVVQMLKEDRVIHPKKAKKTPPPNSIEARDLEYDEAEKRNQDDWDHTTPSELVGRQYSMSGDREEFGWS